MLIPEQFVPQWRGAKCGLACKLATRTRAVCVDALKSGSLYFEESEDQFLGTIQERPPHSDNPETLA